MPKKSQNDSVPKDMIFGLSLDNRIDVGGCSSESGMTPSAAASQDSEVAAHDEADMEAPAKVNILLLADEFFSSHAGTEQHILYLLEKLPRHVFQVHFAVLSQIHQEDLSFPVEPVMLRNGCRSGVVGLTQRLRRLVAYIKTNEIDVVHAFSEVSEVFALVATRLARRGQVLGVRRNTGYWHRRSTLWRARLICSLGAAYVANCDAAKDFVVTKQWVSQQRVTVIRNPVSTDRLRDGMSDIPTADSLGIQAGEQVVGMVATVRPVKDHATFLRAASLLLKEHPQTRFLVVGWQEPDTFADLRKLVSELGIEKQVTWTGAVSNPFSLLPHFDVGVLSSRSEGFSNSLLEYAAAGVATVATDVGGSREIVQDNQTGLLVPPGSPELMAERIGRLLRDKSLRGTFGENARQWVESSFSEEKILRQYFDLYLRLANRSLAKNT